MKKILHIIALALVTTGLGAQNVQEAAEEAAKAILHAPKQEKKMQKPNYWTNSLNAQLNFSQTALTNWAAGGDNTSSLASYIDGNANYNKGAMYWNNRLQLDYGFLYASSKPILQKNNDRIYLESKWGYKSPVKEVNYTANFNFKSQFAPGYTYATPSQQIIDRVSGTTGAKLDELSPALQRTAWNEAMVKKSNFLAPAYTNLALGIDWVPNNWLTINAAPATAGFVIVNDPELRKAYSMQLKNDGKTYAEGDGNAYKSSRFELGAQVKFDIKLDVNDNFKYTTQLVLFSDYLNRPENVRVNWDNRINWKLTKLISLSLVTNLIYDDKVFIKTPEYIKNNPKGDGFRAIQFKEALSIGLSYTFANKKK